jgi:predicted ATPase
MIETIRLLNFKRFRDSSFEFGSLTVLTGRNGTGKSSLIQALLLTRSALLFGASRVVPLNGLMGLNLGEATEILNADSTDSMVRIELRAAQQDFSIEFAVPEDRALYLRVSSISGAPPAALTSRGSKFTYLGAERLGPREINSASSADPDDLGVGPNGEFTAYVLDSLDRVEVGEHGRHPRTVALGGAITLRKQVEYWLGDLLGPVELQTTWVVGSAVTLLRYKYPGVRTDWLRPANIGFGYTYALPVVVAGLLTTDDSTLIVENPEAHLHPEAQSRLGTFLASLAHGGVQVIVETHSDHVINGMRRAVADGACDPGAVLFYFFDSGPTASAKRVSVSPSGALSDWPRGFFDQMEIDLGALARRQK